MPSIALPVSLRGQLLSGSRFNPISLFSAGEQGFWLEPSDLTTMFTDRAGTTPVTTPGQTVGLRLDKSKGLVLGSELITNGDFSSGIAGWTPQDANVVLSTSGGAGVATYSTTSTFYQGVSVQAGKTYRATAIIKRDSGSGTPFMNFRSGTTLASGTLGEFSGTGYASSSYVFASAWFVAASTTTVYLHFPCTAAATTVVSVDNISVKELPGNHAVAPTDAARPTYGIEPKTGRRNLLLATDTMATQSLTVAAVAHTLAFTGTGTVALTGASIAGPLIGTGASNRVSLTFTPTAASLTLTVVGSVTLAQLELGSTATAYQRVGTAFDVTEAGVPTVHYVQYDGTDDSFSTSSINFTATDKMSVFAGVRKLGTAHAILLETSADVIANNGTIAVSAPTFTASGVYEFVSRGSSTVFARTADAYPSPISTLLTNLGNISGDSAIIRVNGTQVAQATGDQGTGNYGNYPLFIGRRNNASLPFNGRDYGIIVVGKTASATEITNTESYLAANTSGVTI